MLKILVTGGLGFIGSNFCRHVITKRPNNEIINLDKIGIGANPASLRDLQKEKRYTFIKGDVCDPELVEKIVKKVDAIVNFAAETHVDRSITDPGAFLHNNTFGTFTILESMRKHNPKARLVQVSTDEVYGDILEGSFNEKDVPKPSNPYSAAKVSADMFVQAYCRTYKLNASITRCTNNFGPYQFPEKLIPKTIIRALKNLQIPIYGTGKNIRDWLFVQDHCAAIDLVREKGKPGEIYNISSSNEISNTEIVRKILAHLGKNEDLITFVQDRPGHDTRYSLDSSKLRSTLEWKPKFTFKKALETTINWYKNNEQWWRPLATKEVLSPAPWKTSGKK
jgi:dTDP-glucose 4,6-dehydratase